MTEDFEAKRKDEFLAFLNGETEDFDMYAVEESKWAFLADAIPGLVVKSAGGMLPFQAEGTLKDFPFYFRYRSGWASLSLGAQGAKEPPYLDGALYSAGMEFGDEYAGSLSQTEFADLMKQLVAVLEPAPFYYRFEGVDVIVEGETAGDLTFTATDTPREYGAWGASPEEAYERHGQVSAYLLEHGWSEEKQRELRQLEAVHPEPINADDRNFPAEPVVFEVRNVLGKVTA